MNRTTTLRSAALAVGVSLVFAPFGAAAEGSMEGKRVAWVLRGYDGYQQAQSAWFKASAEADGAEVTLINGKDDHLLQANAIDDLIAAKVDGIVWQMVDPDAGIESAKKIREAGIPFVYMAHIPEEGSGAPKAPFVPFNDMAPMAKQAGAEAAQWVKDNLNESPKVVLFDWVEIPVCHEERMKPFFEGVKSVAPDAEVIFWDTVPPTKDGTLAKMEDQLQRDPDFNIFTGCGGDLILGGIAGLQANGRAKAKDKVPETEWILTIDGTPEELDLLLDQNTSIVRTISLLPKETGEAVWSTLKGVMSGEIAQDADITVALPALIYTDEMACEEIAKVYETQYGLTDIYTPIDCAKY
jgi:ABC-type sugar transport system substrate-binding protein